MKNVLNTGKKKVIAGATALALVTGAGFGLANTDAGQQLKNWYDVQFGAEKNLTIGQAGQYGIGKAKESWAKVEKDRDATVTGIETAGNSAVTTGSNEIDAAKQAHIKKLNDEKGSIEAGIKAQFDAVYDEGEALIDYYAGEGKKAAEAELGTAAGKAGTDAVNKVNEELAAKAETAKGELREVIKAAKEDLKKQLKENREATVAELNKHTDAKAKEVLKQVTMTAKSLLIQHQEAITAAADDQVAKAKAGLDSVVSDFGN